MPPFDRAEASGHPAGSGTRTPLPLPVFVHLRQLTDDDGLWEHARITTPRMEHGYCTDDNARALLVVSREGDSSAGLTDLAATYLRFVLAARTPTGEFHNRRHQDGGWLDDVGSDDSQGRAWWALGSVARWGPEPWMQEAGIDAFATTDSFGSPHLRSNAYAALGAAEMLAAHPGHPAATDLLRRTSGVIAAAARERIVWPEARVTYDNARLPEALLAAGDAFGDRHLTATGIRMLEWLVRAESIDGHFSFTPVGGWAPGEPRPGFDQQPIEAWAMAEACHRAWTSTGDDAWRVRAIGAARWLMGDNDTGMVLYETATGATGDGLMEHSVNQNQGAESTLAGLAALQIAAACTAAGQGAAIV